MANKDTWHFIGNEFMRARSNTTSPNIRVVTGKAIPTTLYGLLRRPLQQIFIVTPFLEDYEFFGRGPLSTMLERQLAEGTNITLLTLSPEGTNGTNSAFRRKYSLMEFLVARGVEVLFNQRLHAKAFLFDESSVTKACLLGSANLTSAAMNDRLEIAMFTYNRSIFDRVRTVLYQFRNDSDTVQYLQWKHRQATKIKALTEAT